MACYLDFWGKGRPQSDAVVLTHPAAYHCLDVAACGRVLLERHARLRGLLARLLALDEDCTLVLLTGLLALHDVGKWSRPFQAKLPVFYPPCLGNPTEAPPGPHHDAAGLFLWRDRLAEELVDRLPQGHELIALARAVFGHHGAPVDEDSPITTRALYGRDGLEAATRFARDAIDLLIPTPIRVPSPVRASFAVAGFAVLADWLGSGSPL